MGRYAIVKDGIIENIIVAEPAFATLVGAVELSEQAEIGKPVNNKSERISILKAQLTATDYQAIKFSEGWMSKEAYAPIKAQRQEWREEINRLEAST